MSDHRLVITTRRPTLLGLGFTLITVALAASIAIGLGL